MWDVGRGMCNDRWLVILKPPPNYLGDPHPGQGKLQPHAHLGQPAQAGADLVKTTHDIY